MSFLHRIVNLSHVSLVVLRAAILVVAAEASVGATLAAAAAVAVVEAGSSMSPTFVPPSHTPVPLVHTFFSVDVGLLTSAVFPFLFSSPSTLAGKT